MPWDFGPVERTVSSSATFHTASPPERPHRQYNCPVPKRPCSDRAKWKLLRGKPPHPLPAHYQLDCDYGTPVLTIYREGEGDTPTYLCELHAAAERDIAAARRTPLRSVGDDNFDCDSALRLADADSPAIALENLGDRLEYRSAASRNLSPLSPAMSVPAAPTSVVQTPTAVAPAPSSPPAAPAVAPNPKLVAPQPNVAEPEPCTLTPTPRPAVPKASPAVAKPIAPATMEDIARPAAKVPPPKSNPVSKGAVRDLAYGNPAKALVDETIWNLQPGDYDAYRAALRQGKSAAEAAQAAGGQLAVVHRKIHEYAARIDALLAASNAGINVDDAIHPLLESETLKIIADAALTDEQKDAALGCLGEFQEWINRGLKPAATPLKIHQLALAIANRANWGAAADSIADELKSAYRAVFVSLRTAIHTAIPDVRDADDRLVNLFAAKSDLDLALHAETAAPALAPTIEPSTSREKFAGFSESRASSLT